MAIAPHGRNAVEQRDVEEFLSGMHVVSKWLAEESERHGVVPTWENFPIKMLLAISEVVEAVEAFRCNEPVARVEEELADVLIYILSVGSALGMDLGTAVIEKYNVNCGRSLMHGGKKF